MLEESNCDSCLEVQRAPLRSWKSRGHQSEACFVGLMVLPRVIIQTLQGKPKTMSKSYLRGSNILTKPTLTPIPPQDIVLAAFFFPLPKP